MAVTYDERLIIEFAGRLSAADRATRSLISWRMRCPVCQGHMDLRATVCACGFDVAGGDVGNAVANGRRDVRNARLLLLAGIAAAGAFAFLCSADIPDAALAMLPRKVQVLAPLLLAATAIYGSGRGVSLYFYARRRIGILERMRQPAAARVVRQTRDDAS